MKTKAFVLPEDFCSSRSCESPPLAYTKSHGKIHRVQTQQGNSNGIIDYILGYWSSESEEFGNLHLSSGMPHCHLHFFLSGMDILLPLSLSYLSTIFSALKISSFQHCLASNRQSINISSFCLAPPSSPPPLGAP